MPPVAPGCAHHPDRPAELECGPCGALLCPACARLLGDGKTYQCLRCQGLLLPVVGRTHGLVRGPVSRARLRFDATRPLADRLPLTWAYLKRPSVLATLAGTAILQWLASFLGGGMMLVASGVTAALFLHIIETTANGATELDPPDFTDFWQHVLAPLLRMLATVLPLLVAWTLGGVTIFEGLAASAPGAWLGALARPALALIVLWLLAWPVLLMSAAISRSLPGTIDPRRWLRLVAALRGEAVLGTGLFLAALALELFVLAPLVWRGAAALHVPVLSSIAARFLLLVPFAWRARLLGETARPCVDGL